MSIVRPRRTVDEWKLRPGAHDNHWLDCTVGCAVAASMCGCALRESAGPTVVRKERIRLSDLRKTNGKPLVINTHME